MMFKVWENPYLSTKFASILEIEFTHFGFVIIQKVFRDALLFPLDASGTLDLGERLKLGLYRGRKFKFCFVVIIC